MYLHGPHIHERERTDPEAMPPVYVFATFTNQVYRFEGFSKPAVSEGTPMPLNATQKVVGHALAPSTGYVIEDSVTKRIKGLLIAEGQPFWLSNINSLPPHEIYKGGVQYLEANESKCEQIFPSTPFHRLFGQVVNTIDCHRELGICFFTVWKFYDDQSIVWNNFTESVANDCLWYCVLEKDSLRSGKPVCKKTGIVEDENGHGICHQKGVGAVHGMTVGNTDATNPNLFDIFLVFTGKATMDNGESSFKKVKVEVFPSGDTHDIRVLKSERFAEDLFTHYTPAGWDVGGDHAWVDATGKYYWVSCFRSKGVGVHMLDYETGDLIYSVTGLDKYVDNQYTYTAGIHGVGTVGQKGSYLAIATSSCHLLDVCIPTIPWHWPVPKSFWSTAPFFLIDLASLSVPAVEDMPRTIHV